MTEDKKLSDRDSYGHYDSCTFKGSDVPIDACGCETKYVYFLEGKIVDMQIKNDNLSLSNIVMGELLDTIKEEIADLEQQNAEAIAELIEAAEEVIKNRPSLATKVCKLVPPLEQALAKLNAGNGEG